jgi:hypothetical protein
MADNVQRVVAAGCLDASKALVDADAGSAQFPLVSPSHVAGTPRHLLQPNAENNAPNYVVMTIVSVF